MQIPLASDPEVLERLYLRFPYVAGQPLKLRVESAEVNLGTIDTGELLAFVVAGTDEKLPYAPDFPFLQPEETAALAHYTQVRPLEPWPQPLVEVSWNSAETTGVSSSIHGVDILLNPVGNAQLWWGGTTGVIFEAFFEGRTEERPNELGLLRQLWGQCEVYLASKGVREVWTYNRDPRYDEELYKTFLRVQGYFLDVARAEFPGGQIAVVKRLA